MNTGNTKTVTILVVEDDDVDMMAIQRAFKQCKINNPLIRAKDGLEALAMLRGEDTYSAVAKPFLIILDINMPRMNGFDFLKKIRNDKELKTAIVFMLTTSKTENDINRAYEYNVAGYISKTNVNNGFITIIKMIDSYWRVIEFP